MERNIIELMNDREKVTGFAPSEDESALLKIQIKRLIHLFPIEFEEAMEELVPAKR